MISNRENLILSADDFGISQTANKKIIDLIRSGKLDRVSVMPKGTFEKEEIEELKKSDVKLDVHLNLNEKMGSKRKLHKPVWPRAFFFLFKIIFNDRKTINRRWQEEIEKFVEIFGKNPDGINSHEYVHFFPVYFSITLKLAKKYGIPYIRLGRKDLKEKGIICKILNCLRKNNLNRFFSSGLNTSDYMLSLDWLPKINHFLDNVPNGKTELVLHPEREEEYNLVKAKL